MAPIGVEPVRMSTIAGAPPHTMGEDQPSPAGVAVAAATGRPLVVHVHSTEFDRSGEHVNQMVYDIEREGMQRANKVIAIEKDGRLAAFIRQQYPAVELIHGDACKVDLPACDKVVAVNLAAPFFASQAVVPIMRRQGGGHEHYPNFYGSSKSHY